MSCHRKCFDMFRSVNDKMWNQKLFLVHTAVKWLVTTSWLNCLQYDEELDHSNPYSIWVGIHCIPRSYKCHSLWETPKFCETVNSFTWRLMLQRTWLHCVVKRSEAFVNWFWGFGPVSNVFWVQLFGFNSVMCWSCFKWFGMHCSRLQSSPLQRLRLHGLLKQCS
jgi:hypothetical protein